MEYKFSSKFALLSSFFVEDKSRKLMPYLFFAAETYRPSGKNRSSLLEFDSKNLRINHDFLLGRYHGKSKVACETSPISR